MNECLLKLSVILLPTNSILTDLLMCNTTSETATVYGDSSRAQYFFFEIVTHDQLERFDANHVDLNLSYWRCLFVQSFANLKILNMSLSCNDQILKLIAKHCPHLEYLNATSKYLYRDGFVEVNHSHGASNNPTLQLPVSDAGLRHLKACKKLRTLIINEPRGETPITTNQVTYNGLRFLLRNIPSLEDISYSDLGKVITERFDDAPQLNLRILRHHDPSVYSIRRIFDICQHIEQLHLVNSSINESNDIVNELCVTEAQHRIHSIDFQNIPFRSKFSQFFEKFGSNLVSVSLAHLQSEFNFNHVAIVGNNCPNLTFFLCTVSKTERILVPKPKNVRPFRKLKSLYLSGHNIELQLLLPHCTQFANDLEILSLHELTRSHPVVDAILIDCIKSKNIRQLELSRLACSKIGLENIVNHFDNLRFLTALCFENCKDLIKRLRLQNYDFTLMVKQQGSLSLFY